MGSLLKDLSILKKFLFINFVVFIIIGLLTIVYLKNIEPSLIKKKTSNHIKVIDNTINHIKRLKIEFNKDDIRKFLFSTRFLFQNLDRVILLDEKFNIIADTDTLDLDPRSFSQRIDIIEFDNLSEDNKNRKKDKKKESKKILSLKDITINYSTSQDFGKPFTFTQEFYDQFVLNTIKNIIIDDKNVGFLVVSENANEIKNSN